MIQINLQGIFSSLQKIESDGHEMRKTFDANPYKLPRMKAKSKDKTNSMVNEIDLC